MNCLRDHLCSSFSLLDEFCKAEFIQELLRTRQGRIYKANLQKKSTEAIELEHISYNFP